MFVYTNVDSKIKMKANLKVVKLHSVLIIF